MNSKYFCDKSLQTYKYNVNIADNLMLFCIDIYRCHLNLTICKFSLFILINEVIKTQNSSVFERKLFHCNLSSLKYAFATTLMFF